MSYAELLDEPKLEPAHRGKKAPKISVIGTGMVGASFAYTLVVERVAGEIILVDINKERARGEAMDIRHALHFTSPTKITDGDYSDVSGSDIIVITAGVAQKPGETRLVLIQQNYQIYRDILEKLDGHIDDAVIVIVSNPVDILTYATIKHTSLPWQRVIGSGTILDTARLRYELSALCNIDPRNVHGYILGEHGDTEVPLWSTTNIAGVPLRKFCEMCGRGCGNAKLDEVFQHVKNAAYDIIKLKGSTYYAIALGSTRMCEAIARDQNTVMTASTLLHGEYGINDVCLSLPLVVGRDGIRMVIPVQASDEEQAALRRSAATLRAVLNQLGL